jgi:dCMP deaminase
MDLNRVSWHTVFINMCSVLRQRSLCLKYQTSAIVVKGTQILGIGYNGTASKQEECYHYWKNYWSINNINMPFDEWIKTDEFKNLHSKWSVLNEIHAEVNALNWVSKWNIDETCAIYTYYSPCENCAKQILSYGIKKLYYCYKYSGRNVSGTDGIKFLQDRGIYCEQIII